MVFIPVIFAVDSGALYTWGRGSFGKLGLGSNEDQWVPKKASFIVRFSLVFLLVGSLSFFVFFFKQKTAYEILA